MESAEKQLLKKTFEQKLNSKEQKTSKFRDTLRNVRDNISIEPLLACFIIPGALSRLATQNLNLDKACRVNLGYGEEICQALIAKEGSQYQEQEINVQKLIASMDIWKSVMDNAIPIFLILFLGAWSDRTGKRKIFILMPIFGEFLMILSNVFNVYFFYEWPVQVAMFFESFFPAITGSWAVMYMGIFSYISDVSSVESRTFRFGMAHLCISAGGPIGSALSGVLLKIMGYYGVFGISTVLYIASLVYGIIVINDPVRPEITENPSLSKSGFMKSFFDLKHVKETITVAFKKGPKNRRTKSILVFLTIILMFGPICGEQQEKYLFTRFRFNWDAVQFSFYNTIFICLHTMGTLFCVSVFSKWLKWDDSVLALLPEIFNVTSMTALRSIASKLVASEELGKMTSLFNLMEITTAMVFGPLYSWIYMITIEYNAAFIYYLNSVFAIPVVAIFWWFFVQSRKVDTSQGFIEENNDMLEHN